MDRNPSACRAQAMRREGGGRTWEVLGRAGAVPHADVQPPLPRVLSQLLACATVLVYDSSCSTSIPFQTFPVQKKNPKLWCPYALSQPRPCLVKPTQALSSIDLSPSCSYTKSYCIRRSGYGPKLNPGYVLTAGPYSCGCRHFCGDVGCIFVFFFFSLSLFGLTLVFQCHRTVYLCKQVWKVCLILALNQNQHFNREKWYKTVSNAFPQTKLIILLQASFPFSTEPRFLFLPIHLLSLNLLFPFPFLPGDSFPAHSSGPQDSCHLTVPVTQTFNIWDICAKTEEGKKKTNILIWS